MLSLLRISGPHPWLDATRHRFFMSGSSLKRSSIAVGHCGLPTAARRVLWLVWSAAATTANRGGPGAAMVRVAQPAVPTAVSFGPARRAVDGAHHRLINSRSTQICGLR